MFVIAGIAAVIVVAAVVVPMAMRGSTAKSSQTSGALPGGNRTAGPTDITGRQTGGGTPLGTAQQGDSSGAAKPDGADPSGPKQGRNSSLTTIGLELDGAETEVRKDDPKIARALLSRMDKLGPKLATVDDSIRVALIRHGAYLTLQERDNACVSLRRVKSLAAGTRFENRVNGNLEACQ
jgi:hypothetical protein